MKQSGITSGTVTISTTASALQGDPDLLLDWTSRGTIGGQSTGWDQPVVAEDLGTRIRLERLEREFNKRFSVNTVPIHTLGNSTWELKHALPVAVEQRGDGNFIACLYDVDLYGYGETIPDALDDLKEIILDQFEYLSERQKTAKLGSMPQKQLEFLNGVLVKKDA